MKKIFTILLTTFSLFTIQAQNCTVAEYPLKTIVAPYIGPVMLGYALDISGNNFTGFGSNITSEKNRANKAHEAYGFNGVNSYLMLSSNEKTKIRNSDYTFTAWVKIRGYSRKLYSYIACNKINDIPGSSFSLVLVDQDEEFKQGTLQLGIWDGYGKRVLIHSPKQLEIGTWYKVSFTFKYSGDNNNEMKLYLNDQLMGTEYSRNLATPSNNYTYIGYYPDIQTGISSHFNGIVDDIKIENCVESRCEKNNYTAETSVSINNTRYLFMGNDGLIYTASNENNYITGKTKTLEKKIPTPGTYASTIFVLDQSYNVYYLLDNKVIKSNSNGVVIAQYTNFSIPGGIALGGDGSVYVTYKSLNQVVKLSNNLVFDKVALSNVYSDKIVVDKSENIFLEGPTKYTANGGPIIKFPAQSGYSDAGLAIDKAGNIYNAQWANGVIRKYSNDGVLLASIDNNNRAPYIAIGVDNDCNIYAAEFPRGEQFGYNSSIIKFNYAPTGSNREGETGENNEMDGENVNKIQLSPNPTNGTFNISFAEAGTHFLELYNTSGVLVRKEITEERFFSFADDNLTNGLYILNSTCNGVTSKIKVMVAK